MLLNRKTQAFFLLVGVGIVIAWAFSFLLLPVIAEENLSGAMDRPANVASVFLLAGQSNMAGEASIYELSPELATPYPAVQIWQPDTQSFVDLQPGFAESSGESDAFGPELSFGRALHENNDGEIYLIKHALGATNLAVDWNPHGSENQHHIFVTQVKAALDALTRHNIAYRVEGMAWMQGENDAFESEQFAEDYESNLRALIADMRHRYGTTLKFVIGKLHPALPDGFTYQDQVRSAQIVVAADDPLTAIVKTDQLSLQADQVHFDAQGQLDLGLAFAQAMIYSAGQSARDTEYGYTHWRISDLACNRVLTKMPLAIAKL